MKLLLDTHILLWWLSDDRRLKTPARAAIADSSNTVLVSAASIWEMSVKQALGRLTLPEKFDALMASQGFTPLHVTYAHARAVAALPPHHADPFDRLLIAQSQLESATLITHDKTLANYSVSLLLS